MDRGLKCLNKIWDDCVFDNWDENCCNSSYETTSEFDFNVCWINSNDNLWNIDMWGVLFTVGSVLGAYIHLDVNGELVNHDVSLA